MEQLFIDSLFMPLENFFDTSKNLAHADNESRKILQSVKFESNAIAKMLNNMFTEMNTKDLNYQQYLEIIETNKKLITNHENVIKDLLVKINTENNFILEARWKVTSEWLKVLEIMQSNILIDTKLSNSETEKIYQKFSELIDYYDEILDHMASEAEKLQKKDDLINIGDFKSDYSNIVEAVILSTRTRFGLIKALENIPNVDKNLIKLLNDEATSVIFESKQLVGRQEYLEKITVNLNLSTIYTGYLTIKLKVKYQPSRLINDNIKLAKTINFDYKNNWYLGTEDGKLYYGQEGQYGKEIASVSSPITFITFNYHNDWYVGTKSGKLYYGQEGQYGKEIANFHSAVENIGVYYNNDWYVVTADQQVHLGTNKDELKQSLKLETWIKNSSLSKNIYSYSVEDSKLYYQDQNDKTKITEFNANIVAINNNKDNLYVITNDNRLYCVQSGYKVKEIAKLDNEITAFTIKEEKWYLATNKGQIYAGIEDKFSQEIVQLPTQTAIVYLAYDKNNNWYVVNANGQVYFGQLEALSNL